MDLHLNRVHILVIIIIISTTTMTTDESTIYRICNSVM